MRIALALLLAVFIGQVLVVPAAAAREVCAAACPDDLPDGSCDPTCTDCTCCSHGARPLAVGASTLATRVADAHVPAPDPAPTAPIPDPRDVFHVPRLLA